jgi:hypothetical protein
LGAQPKESNANGSVEQKKGIVSFKPGIVVLFVVIFVKRPEETMHNIFVGKPGHEFHEGKSSEKN